MHRSSKLAATLLASLALAVSAAAQDQEKKPEKKAKESAAPKEDLRPAADAAFAAQSWAEAAELYAEVVKTSPDDGTAWHHLGYALHVTGKHDEALAAHEKAAEIPETAGIGAYNAACVHSLRGDVDVAFQWMEKALANGFNVANVLGTDADLENLRKDSRFAKLVEAAKANDRQQAFIATTPRSCARLAYFGQGTSAGQIAIDYGRPAWRDDFGASIESGRTKGQRWRTGQDFWTSWDSSLDVSFGGTWVKAGHYYLALRHAEDGSFVLDFLDPAACRAAKLDASSVARYSGPCTTVKLASTKGDQIAKQLDFRLALENRSEGKGTLSIVFGPYVAKAEMDVKLPRSDS